MLVRRLALAVAVVAGLAGSQAPEFAQQYRQRLGGALDEIKRVVGEFDAETAKENLTPPEGVRRLEQNPDPLAEARGRDMAEAIDRQRRLEAQLQALTSAGGLTRIYVLATNFDPRMAENALDNYEPAAPLTLGGLAAAGLAGFWGWAAVHLVAWPFRRSPRATADKSEARNSV